MQANGESAITTFNPHGFLASVAANNGASAAFDWTARGVLKRAVVPGYSVDFKYDLVGRLREARYSTGQWFLINYGPEGDPNEVIDQSGGTQVVEGPLKHWLTASDPGAFARTWATVNAQHALIRLGDALLPPANAQVTQIAFGVVILYGIGSYIANKPNTPAATISSSNTSTFNCCLTETTTQLLGTLATMTPLYLMSNSAGDASQSGVDQIAVFKSARKLRRNMLCKGSFVLPAGCIEAHHIVAVADSRAQIARDVLSSVGMDINDFNNGVFVPCDQHRGLHTKEYYEKIEAKLVPLKNSNYAAVATTLASIRIQIVTGTF
jgi:hypothetical protein